MLKKSMIKKQSDFHDFVLLTALSLNSTFWSGIYTHYSTKGALCQELQ